MAKTTLRRAADEAAKRAERETREALDADEDDAFDAASLERVRVAGELAGWRAAMRVLSEAGDTTASARLAPNDWYRAERALEVVKATGKPVTAFEAPPDALPTDKYDFTCVALSSPRLTLYRRIDARVEEMVRDGVLHESASMLLAGLEPGSTPASRAIGYRQTMDFLARRAERRRDETDETDGDETDDAFFCSHEKFLAYVEETQRATRAFAKRQFTWFRGEKEGRYFWLDVSLAETHESLTKTVLDLFELGPPPRDLFSVDEDSVETDDAGQTKTPETRGWDAEAFNRLASVHDSSRGATDHETAQELKRYAPRQTVFVDPAASRRTRREVDALAEKISGLKKQ